MVKQVALNNNTHRNLRVITERGADYGENVHIVPVAAEELGSLVLEYPVCLMKNPHTGYFEMSALLGFEARENLFLNGNHWDAIYIPVHMRRQPFLVGFSADETGKRIADSGVLSIDMDSPRVQEEKGERLFKEDGSNSEFLDTMNNLMFNLVTGIDATNAFLNATALASF